MNGRFVAGNGQFVAGDNGKKSETNSECLAITRSFRTRTKVTDRELPTSRHLPRIKPFLGRKKASITFQSYAISAEHQYFNPDPVSCHRNVLYLDNNHPSARPSGNQFLLFPQHNLLSFALRRPTKMKTISTADLSRPHHANDKK